MKGMSNTDWVPHIFVGIIIIGVLIGIIWGEITRD